MLHSKSALQLIKVNLIALNNHLKSIKKTLKKTFQKFRKISDLNPPHSTQVSGFTPLRKNEIKLKKFRQKSKYNASQHIYAPTNNSKPHRT